MASRFTQNFTLADIFNNQNLKNKLPMINYKEKTVEDGKVSYRTDLKTVNRRVLETAKSAARPFYKPMIATQSENMLTISGTLVGDHNNAVDAVYSALQGQKQLMLWTANNAYMIRDALKESEQNKRNNGIDCKLYLRAQSMQQIQGMSRPQIIALLTDIMDNIIYGDDFPITQKKWQVESAPDNSHYTYAQRRENWKQKIGVM